MDGHHHGLPDLGLDPGQKAGRALVVGLLLVGALTLLGLIALWPRGDAPTVNWAAGNDDRAFVDAQIVEVELSDHEACQVEPEGSAMCTTFYAKLQSGHHTGDFVSFEFSPTDLAIPDLSVDDQVVLVELPPSAPAEMSDQAGLDTDSQTTPTYFFHDYQRTLPLVWLLLVFVAAVLLFGRWQGARALAGLAGSLLVLAVFVLPALLRDSPALAVALTASAVVAFLAIYLAHGFNLGSSIALAGTLVSLAGTALLALLMASLAQITGLATDEGRYLQMAADSLDMRGLLVAGIVIGALGVIDDLTVSQVSTVAALRRANPDLTGRQAYAGAIRVGRDHVAAAVNTLVLAYAGASLPLLLIYSQGTLPLEQMLTSELVAVEVIRMLVGSVGLILSVPITTGLAALIVRPPSTQRSVL